MYESLNTDYIQGYLNSLNRLTCGAALFSVNSFKTTNAPIEVDLLNRISIWDCNAMVSTVIKREYSECQTILYKHFYNYLRSLNENEIQLIDWDIQEFFGLLAASINLDEFNPLVSNGAFEVMITTNRNKPITALLVIIGEYGILLSSEKYV